MLAWTDGYGNIKTTIPASSVDLPLSSKVTVRVGDVVSDAVYSDGSFRVPEGTLAFAPGSSGWQKKRRSKSNLDGTIFTWWQCLVTFWST